MPQPTNQLAQPVINLQFSSSVPAYQKFLLLFSLWEFAKANPPLLAEYFHPSIRRPQRLLPIHFNYHGKYTEHTRFSTLPVPIQRHNNSLYSRQRWLFLHFLPFTSTSSTSSLSSVVMMRICKFPSSHTMYETREFNSRFLIVNTNNVSLSFREITQTPFSCCQKPVPSIVLPPLKGPLHINTYHLSRWCIPNEGDSLQHTADIMWESGRTSCFSGTLHYTTLPIPFLINLYPLYVAVPRSTFSHAEYLIPFRDTMIKQNYTALVRQQTDLHETQTNRPVDIKRKLISNRKNCKATRGWDQQLHCV